MILTILWSLGNDVSMGMQVQREMDKKHPHDLIMFAVIWERCVKPVNTPASALLWSRILPILNSKIKM